MRPAETVGPHQLACDGERPEGGESSPAVKPVAGGAEHGPGRREGR